MSQLHKSIHYICSTAVDLLGDSDKFPEAWLFKHRWGKGKKDAPGTLPSGEKIVFLTVGGRTSAVIPSVQKKTGGVARDGGGEGPDMESVDEVNGQVGGVKGKGGKANGSTKRNGVKKETTPEEQEEVSTKVGGKKRKAEEFADLKKSSKKVNGEGAGKSSSKTSTKVEDTAGRRRSGRVKG
jgi:formamidopyrimidine-DNA glycosylase